VVTFTINSIDVRRHPQAAEHGDAPTPAQYDAPSVIVPEDWRHVAQAGIPTTRLQAKAVWGPRAR
jgi:hypothetical protein